MPDFHFSEQQLVELVNAIHANSQKATQPSKEVPIIIHFDEQQKEEEAIFVRKCGACHRMLTKLKGGLGSGYIGPNLSGLFTEFYPKSYPQEKSWTVQALKDWLKNPRKVLKNARMNPVELKQVEWEKLQIDLLDGQAQPMGNNSAPIGEW